MQIMVLSVIVDARENLADIVADHLETGNTLNA